MSCSIRNNTRMPSRWSTSTEIDHKKRYNIISFIFDVCSAYFHKYTPDDSQGDKQNIVEHSSVFITIQVV